MARTGAEVQVITENRVEAILSEVMAPRLNVRRIPPADAGRLWRIDHIMRALSWRGAIKRYASGHLIWATDPSMAIGAMLAHPLDRVIFNPAACAAGIRHIWKQYPDADSLITHRHLVWLDRLAYRHAQNVVVSSMNVKQQFERFYGTRPSVHVVPYAADSPVVNPDRARARERFGIHPSGFCVGFVGRLDPCKDIPFLLTALACMSPGPHDRLLIVGDGPDAGRLRRIAEERGVAEHIVWAGRLNPPDEALAAMDVLVLPSYYEAFGLVLLEAMAFGVPVIARASDGETVLTAASEVITPENGIVVPSHDSNALASALGRLRNSNELRTRLSEGAKRYVLRRTWDDVAREAVHILRMAS
jgi:glycosyltransferase involved in cell wall biosynthesis